MDAAIEIQDLSFRYSKVEALRNIVLSVPGAQRIALIGHNGAGKTTLIKLILGLLPMQKGLLRVLGDLPGSMRTRMACAYLPENLAFNGLLTGREQLTFLSRLRGAHADVSRLLDRVELSDAADRRIAGYSKGMRQRLGLAQLILHEPKLIVLDEPTTGLDPVSRYRFYEILSEQAAKGAAIIFSSHVLTELEAQTDRIVILHNGEVKANGSISELRRVADLPTRLKFRTRKAVDTALIGRLGATHVNGHGFEIAVREDDKVLRLKEAVENGADVEDVEIIPPDLNALFRHFSTSERNQ